MCKDKCIQISVGNQIAPLLYNVEVGTETDKNLVGGGPMICSLETMPDYKCGLASRWYLIKETSRFKRIDRFYFTVAMTPIANLPNRVNTRLRSTRARLPLLAILQAQEILLLLFLTCARGLSVVRSHLSSCCGTKYAVIAVCIGDILSQRSQCSHIHENKIKRLWRSATVVDLEKSVQILLWLILRSAFKESYSDVPNVMLHHVKHTSRTF